MKSSVLKILQWFFAFVALFDCRVANAQFNTNGEFISRSEYRHGYGNPIHKDSLPAIFTGSRFRVQLSHTTRSVKMHASIQDVRTYGSVPGKGTDPLLSLYEAWIQIRIDTNFKLKAGRQELNYDNSRFLGSADWVLAGRSHDFVLFQFEKAKVKADAGFGFNQDGEKLSGNIYSNSNYKTAQLLRAEYKTAHFEFVVIGWNEGRQFIKTDSTGKLSKQGMRFLQTAGIPSLKFNIKNTTLQAFYYHQFGIDSKGKKTDAFDCSFELGQSIKLSSTKNRAMKLSAGIEIVSGTKASNLTENRSFMLNDGTNHAHNGYMDLFYVGGRHDRSVGLIDGYFKFKYDLNKHLFLLLNAHYFKSQVEIYNKTNDKLDSYLGTELDFTAGTILYDKLSLQAGYSHFFNSPSFNALRGMTFISNTQNWAYLMLIYRPNGKKLFTGIVF